jgi:hypothetical protein
MKKTINLFGFHSSPLGRLGGAFINSFVDNKPQAA